MKKGVKLKKQYLKTSFLLLFLGLFLAVFLFQKISPSDEKVATSGGIHQNEIDLEIRQLSDKKITKNAINSDQKFSQISFVPQESDSKNIFESGLANVLRTVTSIKASDSKNREYGTWLWTPTLQMTPEYITAVLDGAKTNNINTIYLSIDSYLDIYVMEDGKEKTDKYQRFINTLNYFIKEAKNRDIKVDAEAGWRNWAEPGHVYKPLAIVDFVKKFNESGEYDFRGLQYDIEPYLLDEYYFDEAKVLKNFVMLVDETMNRLVDTDLRFSVVIPDFFDEKDGFSARFAYNDETDSTFGHLLKILDRKYGSSIILMSYRNYAEGEDGTIDISMNEIETVEEGFFKTQIIIAQEVGEVEPPYITFHNTSKEELKEQVILIEKAFKGYPNFGGIAYHYLNSLLTLK